MNSYINFYQALKNESKIATASISCVLFLRVEENKLQSYWHMKIVPVIQNA
jgi:hypothetical protein